MAQLLAIPFALLHSDVYTLFTVTICGIGNFGVKES
jgi:hypothetical protein